MSPSLWLRLVSVLAIIVLPVGLYLLGLHDGRADERQSAEAAKVASLRRAIEQAAEIAQQDAEVLTFHEARAESIRVVYRSLNQEASRYALNHDNDPCGLDADGLRLWTAANAGTIAAAPAAATPYAALPGIGAAHIGRVDGSADEPHRGGAAVSVVPGTTADVGRMGMFSTGAAVME
jgi:hypothetical protein